MPPVPLPHPPPPLGPPPSFSFATLPVEILISILALLPARDVLVCQRVCRSWYCTASSPRLWMAMADALVAAGVPVPPLAVLHTSTDPAAAAAATAAEWTQATSHGPPVPPQSALQHALIDQVLRAQQLAQRWSTYGCEPLAVQRIRAHIDRITAMKILPGPRGLLVLTASVDNWIRVWDLSVPLPPAAPAGPDGKTVAVADTLLYSAEAADLRLHSERSPRRSVRSSSARREDEGPRSFGPGSSARRSSTQEGSRRSFAQDSGRRSLAQEGERRSSAQDGGRQRLLAEIDTGVEILCLDAEIEQDNLVIAVGTCVSSSCCLVYVVNTDDDMRVVEYSLSSTMGDRFVARAISLRGPRVGKYQPQSDGSSG